MRRNRYVKKMGMNLLSAVFRAQVHKRYNGMVTKIGPIQDRPTLTCIVIICIVVYTVYVSTVLFDVKIDINFHLIPNNVGSINVDKVRRLPSRLVTK